MLPGGDQIVFKFNELFSVSESAPAIAVECARPGMDFPGFLRMIAGA
jgi:hypothetical protein